VWTTRELVDVFVLLFIPVGSQRVYLAGLAAHPDAAWVKQQARNVAMHFAEQPGQADLPAARPRREVHQGVRRDPGGGRRGGEEGRAGGAQHESARGTLGLERPARVSESRAGLERAAPPADPLGVSGLLSPGAPPHGPGRLRARAARGRTAVRRPGTCDPVPRRPASPLRPLRVADRHFSGAPAATLAAQVPSRVTSDAESAGDCPPGWK